MSTLIAKEHYKQGIEFGLLKDYQQAIFELTRAVELEPDFVEAYVSLGVALHKAGQDDKALENYEAAINLSPEYAEAHYFHANIYHIRQQMPQAIAGYTIAIGLNPALINAHNKRPLKGRLTDYT
jgi:tetratricopeptide (TPR) repeat protein